MGADSGWQLRLLDNFRLIGTAGDVPLSARKAVALLAYLAMQQDRMARREVLATLLWENADPAQARVSLRQALAAIRKIESEESPLLSAEGDFIRLAPEVDVDARRFERLAEGDHAARSEAPELYRTDLLGGFSLKDSIGFNEWLGVEQARLRQRAVGVLHSLVEDALQPGGDLNAGIASALRLLTLDAYNEAGHRGLMQLYTRQGRAALALAQYRSLSDLLRHELAVAPEAETSRLYEEIKSGRRRLVEDAVPQPATDRPDPGRNALVPGPEIERLALPGSEPSGPAPLPAQPQSRGRLKSWRLPVAGIAALCLAIAVLGYFWTRDGGAPPRLGQVFPIATSDEIEAAPALSPDGEQLAYTMTRNGNRDIYLLPASGDGAPMRLTDNSAGDGAVAWRPDGLAIAFVRTAPSGDRPCEIILKPVPVGDERVIGRCITDYGTSLSWMPDGRSLVFRDMPASGKAIRLYRLDVESGKVRPISNPPQASIGDFEPSVSHDGRFVVFQRSSSLDTFDLMLLDLETGEEQRLSAGHSWSAVWEHDDRGLIYSARRKGDYGLWWIDPSRPGEPHRLSAGVSQFRALSYSARRNRLVFEAMQERNSLLQLPKDASPDTAPTSFPAVRPGVFTRFVAEANTGDVLFVSGRSGHDEIWIAPAGQPAKQRTRFTGWRFEDLSWSPDGSWIAFVGLRNGSPDLYLIRRDGGEPVRLTNDAVEEIMPAWSPDGQTLYFGSRRGGAWRIWRMDPAQPRSAHPVTDAGPWRAVPSANGRSLYYVVDGQRGIRRRDFGADGRLSGPETMVVQDVHPSDWRNWAVTSDAIFYVRRAGPYSPGWLRRYDLASGEDRAVTDATNLAWMQSFALRRDGGLLLARRDVQIDIYGSDLD
ncbi:BTAD domain-containing putative transcriptional regulator [Allosphingosinicella deserti]|uniref:Bacterial transcriptional activator domain-containing protein n=1 Tax=Allosphingosinicella deserti TaxID=2116704 RepID=A0A2P7QSL6_9SPHN|nr:BTAD domain-containing putative transcriptional regulator [Sphingomonas deserti]PSJ40955.1 hypothetical protein C7I55_11890 [Sphingomonas deserti]